MPSMSSKSRETPPSSPDPSWTSQPARPNARSTVPWNPKNQSQPRTHRIPAAFLTECDEDEEWLPPLHPENTILRRSVSSKHDSDSGHDSDGQVNDQPTTITESTISTTGRGRAGALNITQAQWVVIVSMDRTICCLSADRKYSVRLSMVVWCTILKPTSSASIVLRT
jgi:hypothetical protein